MASGREVEVDAEREADADIPETVAAVRRHFREHGTAFFDDVVAATGCEEGAAMRAVWHLAWCGEVTCDTYECLRYADFQVTLSACYDLDSTPIKIVRGRMDQTRVLRQMRRRRLDPRLGRWSATDRLIPPESPPSESEIAARWTDQLLRRWGIVPRDLVGGEPAAPAWATLVRELKRRELLGQVNRGYFIESHHGEENGWQVGWGLPNSWARWRGDTARVWIRVAHSFVDVDPWAKAVHVAGQQKRRRFWRHLRVATCDDLTPEKAEALLAVLGEAQRQAESAGG